MTKEELMKEYQLKEVGDSAELVIQNPGKFEGMPLFVPYFWDMMMNGEGEALYDVKYDMTYTVIEITEADREMFPVLTNYDDFILLYSSDEGFAQYEIMTADALKALEEELNKDNGDIEGKKVKSNLSGDITWGDIKRAENQGDSPKHSCHCPSCQWCGESDKFANDCPECGAEVVYDSDMADEEQQAKAEADFDRRHGLYEIEGTKDNTDYKNSIVKWLEEKYSKNEKYDDMCAYFMRNAKEWYDGGVTIDEAKQYIKENFDIKGAKEEKTLYPYRPITKPKTKMSTDEIGNKILDLYDMRDKVRDRKALEKIDNEIAKLEEQLVVTQTKGAEQETAEYVNAEDVFEDDNKGYKYGVEWGSMEEGTADVQWFKTEAERAQFVKKNNLKIMNANIQGAGRKKDLEDTDYDERQMAEKEADEELKQMKHEEMIKKIQEEEEKAKQNPRKMGKHGNAICEVCGKEMTPNNTGCYPYFVDSQGKYYERIPYGGYGEDTSMPCHDCNVKEGGYHHDGCDSEICPVCHGQALGGCCDLVKVAKSKPKKVKGVHMDWPYYTLKDGKLVDEDGNVQFEDKTFKNEAEAEKFLEDNDYRGNVK